MRSKWGRGRIPRMPDLPTTSTESDLTLPIHPHWPGVDNKVHCRAQLCFYYIVLGQKLWAAAENYCFDFLYYFVLLVYWDSAPDLVPLHTEFSSQTLCDFSHNFSKAPSALGDGDVFYALYVNDKAVFSFYIF